jgi:predicted O-methyltransferase YrrM
MIFYGREFSVRQAAKLFTVIGVASGPLLFAALRKGPTAAFEFAGRSLELFKELTTADPLPAITFEQLGVGSQCSKQIWIDLDKPSPSMPPGELALLCSLVRWKNPKTVVEIGTYRGFTTLHLSRNTSEACRIFTADLPPGMVEQKATQSSDPQLIREAARTKRVFGDDSKIVQILQDSATIDWGTIVDRPIDFALVDGSHLYEHVRKDTEGVLKALAPGGVIVWHDYLRVEIRRGVGRYLTELHNDGLPIYRLPNTTLAVHVRTA